MTIFVIVEKLYFTIVFRNSKKTLLHIWSYIILVDMKVVKNDILNNFNLRDYLPRVHR